MKFFGLFAGALLLASAATASAQDWGVSRERYTFLDNELTLEVIADMPGTLQVVRGEPGLIEVSGRSRGGMATWALGGRYGSTLRLTAMGGDMAQFMVVVPEDAYLRVRLPNRKYGEVGRTRPSGSFSWGNEAARRSADLGGLGGPAYSSSSAPRSVNIPRLTAVRSVSVRIGGSAFDISGQHLLGATANGSQVDVRTGDQADDVVINVPAMPRDFTLRLGGRLALSVHGNEVTTYCEPVTDQILDEVRRWLTFTPEAGLLSCR